MRRTGERGGTLGILLLGMVALAGAIAAFLSVEKARQGRALAQVEGERAFGIAESGVDQVAVLLNADAWNAGSTLNWISDDVDNDGDGLVDEGDERLSATSNLWATDGADNDADGQVDEEDEQIARVRSFATIGRTTRSVTGWLRRTSAILPTPAGAVYLNDPFATTTFSGNAFRVDGNDVNLNGTPGPAPPLYGMAINGDPQQVVAQLSGQQQDNVLGIGGYPSVGAYAPNDPQFIQSFIDAFEANASVVFNNYGGTYTGSLGDWTSGQFEIAKSNGNFQVGGGSTGAGILLVEGDLDISGEWDYVGYIFVTGRVRMSGGGGGKRLRGALFVGGDVIQSGSDFTITGTVEILYSSEALFLVRNAFGHYTVTAVTEP